MTASRARAFRPEVSAPKLKSIKPVDNYPDYDIFFEGSWRRVTDRGMVNRPMTETEEQKKARAKTGEPAPMLQYMVGRIVW